MEPGFHSDPDPQPLHIPDIVAGLVRQYTGLWWASEAGFPPLTPVFSLREKFRREAILERFLAILIGETGRYPTSLAGRSAARERLTAAARTFVTSALDLSDRHMDVIQENGFIDAAIDFMQRARRFDPSIREEDIYQASRNVWSMNLFQLLFGLPVQVTPSIFAYSMLYPYTDNYLDDPAFSPEDKRTFNQRFACRLVGQTVSPANANEARIFELVGMVEGQYERARFPLVYESLLAIHAAQVKSLRLLAPQASPYEIDVLGIDFEKGGAATLADGYLVAGSLTAQQREFVFGYGVFTQLMDDQEDLYKDLRDGLLTVFTQTAAGWKLDAITNRLFCLGARIMGQLEGFAAPEAAPARELIQRGIDLLLIDAAGRARHSYSRAYLRDLETFFPFRFSFLDRQRKKLNRQQLSLSRMIGAFAAPLE
jgi:hypothetical protein